MTAPRDGGPDPRDSPTPPNDSESAHGGADAIQKTSYVTGSGTEPGERTDSPVIARVETGRGPNLIGWVVVALAALLALVYGMGVLF